MFIQLQGPLIDLVVDEARLNFGDLVKIPKWGVELQRTLGH